MQWIDVFVIFALRVLILMKLYEGYSDEQLFSKVKKGDNEAFTVLFERFFPILLIHALHKLNDSQDAKDIVQETFITLYQKKDSINIKKNFSGYVYRILKNKILNFISKKNVRANYQELIEQESAFDFSEHNDVDSYVFENELKKQIEEGIDLLPEKMRVVFEMSRFEHLSHKEIADQLNISDKTVKRQIVNALKIIRSKIHFFFF